MTRCGYIALVGRPNAGKSTLFNAFLGQRLSIVTAKPQTTRGRVLGILTEPGSQMIFLDTPGLLNPTYRLHERMEHQIDRAVDDADVVVLLIDATLPNDRRELVEAFLSALRVPLVPVLNKVDLVPAQRLQSLLEMVGAGFGLGSLMPISALRGDHVDAALARVVSYLPTGPMLYPEDMIAEQPERFFVAELIRESAFRQLSDELPYAVNVTVEEFHEGKQRSKGSREQGDAGSRKTYIRAILFVERESQKGIVIGRKAARLQSIGRQARAEIEEFLGREVYLDLWVKVRPDWRNRDRDLQEFGYI